MKCPRPITVPVQGTVPCGQCLGCRINKQRQWATRIQLEAQLHNCNSFATLTYSNEHLTYDLLRAAHRPTLRFSDLTKWLKRFRKQRKEPFRYFAVGEYGDEKWRPHFHAVLFGVGMHEFELVRDTWGKGRITLTDLCRERAMYCAHYTVKKLCNDDYNSIKLQGRVPEQARMSRRPGLGKYAVDAIAASVEHRSDYAEALEQTGDVPGVVRMDQKMWPLDRYTRTRLRDLTGIGRTYYERGQRVVPQQATQEELDQAAAKVKWMYTKQEPRDVKKEA